MLPSLLKLFKDGPVTEELPPRVDPETFKPEAPRPEVPKALVRLAPIREAPAPKPLSDDTIRQRAIRKWADEQALKGELDPAAMGAVGPEAERGYYEWEARRRGIGEDIPGTDAIRVGEALPPREVSFNDSAFTGAPGDRKVLADMARKVADAKERAPELSVGNRFGFQYDPPQDPPEIAFRNEAGRLGEEPGALEAGVTGLVGIPAGAFNAGWKMGQRAAGEAPTGVLPDGYIPGVGIGETIAEAPDAIAQALKKRAMNTVARVQEKGLGAAVKEETGLDLRRPTWLGGETSAEDKERRKAAGVDNIADSLIEGVSRIPDELKGLAVSTWQAGTGAVSGLQAMDDRSIPTERKVDKALGLAGDLATAIPVSLVDQVIDPRSAFEKTPVGSILNASVFAGPAKAAAAKAAARPAQIAELEGLAARFKNGVQEASDIRSELAAERASITEAQGDLLRRRRDLHETGNYDNTSQRTKALDDMAAEEEALTARADQLTMSEAEFKAGPQGKELAQAEAKAAAAEKEADRLRQKGGALRRLLGDDHPDPRVNKLTLPEREQMLAAGRSNLAELHGAVIDANKVLDQARRDLDVAKAKDPFDIPRDVRRRVDDAVREVHNASYRASSATAKKIADGVAYLDKMVNTSKQADALVKTAARVPSWVATFGVTGATDLATHLVRRNVTKPGAGFRRYIAYARTDRVPEEMLALEREMAGSASRAEMDVTDALQAIPEDARPRVSELLRRESDAALNVNERNVALGGDFETAPPSIIGLGARPRIFVGQAELDAVTMQRQAQELADIGNKYGKGLLKRAQDDHAEAVRLGLAKETDPVWPVAYRKGATKIEKADKRVVTANNPQGRYGSGAFAYPDEVTAGVYGREGLEGEVEALLDRSAKVKQHQLYEKAARDSAISISADQFAAVRAAELAEDAARRDLPRVDPSASGIVTKTDRAWKQVPDRPDLWGKLAGRYVKEDVWYELANAAALSEQMGRFLPKLIAKWKGGMTAWNPLSHGRNVLTSALVFAPMAGISPLNPINWPYYAEALKDLARGSASQTMRESIEAGTFRGGFRAEIPKLTKSNAVPYRDPSPSSLYGRALKVVDDHIGGAIRAGASPVTGLLKLAFSTFNKSKMTMEEARRLAKMDPSVASYGDRLAQMSRDELAKLERQTEARAKVIFKDAKRRHLLKSAGEGWSEMTSLPGALFGVEDDVFRHALFLKRRAELATAGTLTRDTLGAAGREARAAFVDYENVPGFVQVLRAPFSPVTSGATPRGEVLTQPLGQLAFYGAAQPFISFSSRSIPAVRRWLADNPIIAQTWINLHDRMSDLAYVEAGYTDKERDNIRLGVSRTMDFPEVELLPFGADKTGEVRIVNVEFLNPAGNYLPRRDSLESAWRNVADYATQIGIGGNPIIDVVRGVTSNRDPFSGVEITKGTEAGKQLQQLGGWVAGKLVPRAVTNAVTWALDPKADAGDLVSGPGYTDKFGQAQKPEVLKTRTVDPEKELGKAGRAVYSLLKRADDSARATLADAGTPVLARYSDMDPGTRRRFDEAWVDGVRPFADAVRKKLEGLPASPQQKRALAKLRSALRVKDPARVRAKLFRLFGGLSGDLGDLQARLRKEADEGQENP